MDEKNNARRDYLTIEALNPADGKTCEVLISFDRMQTVGRRSMGHAKECGLIVPPILQKPIAVFEGIRREEDEDTKGVGWRCYCGIPENAYHTDGTKRTPYPGQVYLVFVNDEGVAYNWRWEKADSESPNLPVGFQSRFRKQVL
jgi:hypothetical protein